jgi:glycosyltransferase involved in cell wall biosynthesis
MVGMTPRTSARRPVNWTDPQDAPSQAPTLSVAIVTYNHERYIAQAVDSVLAQRTSFPFEIVIGDDGSRDGTPQILQEYAGRYNHIRLLLSPRNLGITQNYLATLSACRGSFVAMLDGDDYWSRPDKLETQLAFLERHPECMLCFHNVMKVFEDGSREPVAFCPPDQKPFSDLRDLLVANFIPTLGAMFRRDPSACWPSWLHDQRVVDWPLHILNARRGPIAYLDAVMGVYRIHSGGDWSSMDRGERTTAIIRMYERLEESLDAAYGSQVRSLIATRYLELARFEQRRGNLGRARGHALRGLVLSPYNPYSERWQRRALFVDLFVPFLRRWWRVLRPVVKS